MVLGKSRGLDGVPVSLCFGPGDRACAAPVCREGVRQCQPVGTARRLQRELRVKASAACFFSPLHCCAFIQVQFCKPAVVATFFKFTY